MNNSITVHEKYFKHWPTIAVISGMGSLAFYAFYQLSNDVLVEGYLQLTAFIFFAISILSLFKVKDGKVTIRLTINRDSIDILYSSKNKMIYEESLNISDIDSLKEDQMPNKSIYNDFKKSDRCVRFKRKKTSNWEYLNEVYGRVIPLSSNNVSAIIRFIENNKFKSDHSPQVDPAHL